ncbi:translation initiation factor IF-2-like [Panicum virgatum]|uniref:translation initiation factor IF-2-like n=1 Tax=Panicum virgatum TaxID=38727 RepID=UPI0019D5B5C5|nr:translation initiation factor IF-2-like [Panicum virgatum]
MADDTAGAREEQARRAQALAEKCFLAGNVHGARQWMQSAVRLAPGLPGAARVAAAYDVHAAAARGPPECWLCLLVHPDKNPCAAADGAFKLVHAAWEALSARHPPGAAPARASQPAPQPQYRQQATPPRPRPQVVQMQRRPPATASRAAGAPTTSSYAHQASRPPEKGSRSSPLPPKGPRPTSPARDKCPACGACTTNGKRSFRCGSCRGRPADDRPPDDDDDFFEDDYY